VNRTKPVTDPDLDAPDGAEVDGWKRTGDQWHNQARAELDQKFTGKSGLKPHAEARRYVYGIIDAMLQNEIPGDGGWIYGGYENEFDVRRLKKAVLAVRKEMRRKADR
jgi:hypothetical protein